MTTKQELRSHIRKLKQAFLASNSIAQQQAQANRIFAKLEQMPEFQKAQTVLAYYSLPDELLTPQFLDRWASRKTILLPKVEGEELTIHPYTGTTSIAPGAFGIMEPTTPPYADPSNIDLVIVPGMAFDTKGNRLGRGRGYYDKLFAHLLPPTVKRIGACYPFQLLSHIPTQDTDIPMDAVVY